MSQRNSEYTRKAHELYETPEWVTKALLLHLDIKGKRVWEPACGSGIMANTLLGYCDELWATDIRYDGDFFDFSRPPDHVWRSVLDRTDVIITNPPYGRGMAQKFIEHALRLMEPNNGQVAMLLKCDFEHAKTRSHLFRDCPMFAKKIVLTKRIVWFERKDGKKASPSENHAWFIWDYKHKGPPTLAFGP